MSVSFAMLALVLGIRFIMVAFPCNSAVESVWVIIRQLSNNLCCCLQRCMAEFHVGQRSLL